ncbi:hypothetical protein PG993_000079 [Apiospora rasikravindrae]|uniref:Uncharacterized protein n=1 Tax=Apiospora rasikravindrae TaxID=990691 RepID=A0ABR1U7H6_9PEZI
MLLTVYVLSCVMLSALARRATDRFGPEVTLKEETSTTTHVSVISSSTSPSQSPTATPHSGFTEPSSCTDARRAVMGMDLRHSPNAPLFPEDWPKGCREIQDSLKQIADAFLPTAYLPKEKIQRGRAPPELPARRAGPRRRRGAGAGPPRGAHRDGARRQYARSGRGAGAHGLRQAERDGRAGGCGVDDGAHTQGRRRSMICENGPGRPAI